MTAQVLLENYEAGRRNFMCADLTDADLRRANLEGADLSGAKLSEVTLTLEQIAVCKLTTVELQRQLAKLGFVKA